MRILLPLRLLLLLMLTLSGCWSAPTALQISPLRASDAWPRMILSVRLYDATTGRPVNDGDIYWLPGVQRPVTAADLRAQDGWGGDIYLSGDEDGWLIIQAPGYEEYALRVKYQIARGSRWLDVPVRLKRIGEGGV